MTRTFLTVSFGSVTFTGEEIKAAQVIEQINPLATELPINTLELTLFSVAGDFSIVNPSGFYANLQYKQPLDIYETINGSSVYLGKYYLDKWESISANEAKFYASDAIGLLDSKDFLIGYVFTADLDSDDVIDRIMSAAGIGYNLDASLEGINVGTFYVNTFPVVSCRVALQNVLFAIGAYATCARSNIIQIKSFELAGDLGSFDHVITTAQKSLNSPVTLRPLATGVQIASHDFNAIVNNAIPTDYPLYSTTVETGEVMLILPDKARNYFENGTLSRTTLEETPYYLKINVTVAGTWNVFENAYFPEGSIIKTIVNGSLPVGTPSNIIKINDAFCVRSHNINTITQRVYDYYQQRYLQNAKLFAQQVAPGDSVLIAAQGKWIAGIIERMETDLTGGFVSNVEIIGVIYGCDNVLSADLTVPTGTDQTYTDCLDMLNFNIDLQGSANLIIN